MLYGVDPPEIVIFELWPAKIEIVLWLNDIEPEPFPVLLTLTVNEAQLPPYEQTLTLDVPVEAFPISVKIFAFMLACIMLGFELDET